MPVSVENQSVRLPGTVVTDVRTALERVFERRIPVAAAVAAGEEQRERQHRKNERRGPHHPSS
jgi:hypothetical protein